MDKGKLPICIFLDLSKAFDTIDHSILLEKLTYYGVKNSPANLFKSYLEDRKQYVEFDDIESDMLSITTGVPQGSILGPLLFIIYLNDIAYASKMFELILYADDSTLSTTLNSFNININADINDDINAELIKITDWLNANKLSLNVTKTKFMVFHQPRKKFKMPNLKLNDFQIENVDTFNFLGITIDKHLNWNAHIDKVCNKISRSLGIMNKLKNMLPITAKIKIYNSLILSHLNYGILVWGYKCSRILKLQKRAVRIISCKKYNAHTSPLFKNLKLLKIDDIFSISKVKFYHKFVNNKLPENLQKLPLKLNQDTHRYATRRSGHIYRPKFNHSYAKKLCQD